MAALNFYAGLPLRPVALEEVLAAREARKARQDRLLATHGLPLLSMTLNMPGPRKRTPLSAFFFDRELARLTGLLEGLGGKIRDLDRLGEVTGDEAILSVEGIGARPLKALAVKLEEESSAARLLDLDVLDVDGKGLSRTSLGLPQRTCLLCDQPAFVCSSRQVHPLSDLEDRLDPLLLERVGEILAGDLQRLALEASSFELMVAPKPGLVTPFGSGSHPDMDRFSFSRSQAALGPYYREAFLLAWQKPPVSDLSLHLRLLGLGAEGAMSQATGGVNTHRGWIYLSGILIAATALFIRSCLGGLVHSSSLTDLSDLAASLARDLEEDLKKIPFLEGVRRRTRGEDPDGIRKEALEGFPSLFKLGLPLLLASRKKGEEDNRAGQRALLALIAAADDSTLKKRAGDLEAQRIRRELTGVLAGGTLLTGSLALDGEEVEKLTRDLAEYFQTKGLTAGGGADLLAGSRLLSGFYLKLVMGL